MIAPLRPIGTHALPLERAPTAEREETLAADPRTANVFTVCRCQVIPAEAPMYSVKAIVSS